jgi:D-amino-acid dehydrogenase
MKKVRKMPIYAKSMPPRETVAIIGAGVVGAATALKLAEAGYRVVVVDQAPVVAAGASHANGAQLSYSFTNAMGNPAMLRSLPALMLGRDPAVRVHMAPRWDYMRWGLAFLRNCTARAYRQNTFAALALAVESRAQMQVWLDHYQIPCAHQVAGKVVLYASDAELEAQRCLAAQKTAQGVMQHVLCRAALLQVDPAFAAMDMAVAGGVYAPDDAVADPAQFAAHAIETAIGLSDGALLLGHTVQDVLVRQASPPQVVGLRTQHGDIAADYVVVCAGLQTPKFRRFFGHGIPIFPSRGYSLTYPKGEAPPAVSITYAPGRFVLCPLGDYVRIAGIADMGRGGCSGTETGDPQRLQALRDAVRRVFPKACAYDQECHSWSGVRPMTPTSLPLIAPGKVAGLYVNSGHGMLGWTLAAGSACRLLALLQKA